MALRGYPFYGTGAASGGAATVKDPSTSGNPTITEIPIPPDASVGGKVRVKGVTLSSDALGLGIYARVIIGNSLATRYGYYIFPHLDADAASQPTSLNTFEAFELEVGVKNSIGVTLYDPGAAALMSGVIWVDDGQPGIPIPDGQLITYRMGGTNDGSTTYSTTGADLVTTDKLDPDCDYYVVGARTTSEDKVLQEVTISGTSGRVAVAAPAGTIWYPEAMDRISGAATPVGAIQVQAATKAQIIWYLVEVPRGNSAVTPPKTGGGMKFPSGGFGMSGGASVGGSVSGGFKLFS